MRSGSHVLVHSTTLPDFSPSTGSTSRSTTASTWSVSNTASTIGSHCRASSAIEAAASPPSVASRAVLTASMSRPITRSPAPISRRANASPIRPTPTSPTGDVSEIGGGLCGILWLRRRHRRPRCRLFKRLVVIDRESVSLSIRITRGGAPRNSTRFAARYPARGHPCERFKLSLAASPCITRGRGGWLGLTPWKTFTSYPLASLLGAHRFRSLIGSAQRRYRARHRRASPTSGRRRSRPRRSRCSRWPPPVRGSSSAR